MGKEKRKYKPIHDKNKINEWKLSLKNTDSGITGPTLNQLF